MNAVALKGLFGRKLRTFLTALAIVLGVSMISGTYVLTDTITASFTNIVDDSYSNSNAVISGKVAFKNTNSNTEETPAFPASVLADELLRRDAVLRQDLDLVVLADLVEELLRCGYVEDCDRRGTDRGRRSERRYAGDLELASALVSGCGDRVADREVLLVGGPLVDRDLPVADGPLTGYELQRVEPAVIRRIDTPCDRLTAAGCDDFPVPIDQLHAV